MGEWVYLNVCLLRGPGHDGSVGEWVYLNVCLLRGPGHDSSVGEWMFLTPCPLRSPGSIPGRGGVDFFVVDQTLPIRPEPA